MSDRETDEAKVALKVKLQLTDHEVEIRWLEGGDSVLFESFCGMLKRVVDGMKLEGWEKMTMD